MLIKEKWMKFKKLILNKIAFWLIPISLFVVSIGLTAFTITSSKSYYEHQFEKYNTLEEINKPFINCNDEIYQTTYTKEDLDTIIVAIIDYLANKTDSMQVKINGQTVFSNQALIHMKDVKDLYMKGKVLVIINVILFILSIGYLIVSYHKQKDLFNFKAMRKRQIIFFIILGSIAVIIVVMMLINFRQTFRLFHYLIFPDPIKVRDAFFGVDSYYEEDIHINNVLLVKILQSSVFKTAGFIIISVTILTQVIYFILITVFKKRIENKMLQE